MSNDRVCKAPSNFMDARRNARGKYTLNALIGIKLIELNYEGSVRNLAVEI